MQNITAGLTLELFTQKLAIKIESSTLRQYLFYEPLGFFFIS